MRVRRIIAVVVLVACAQYVVCAVDRTASVMTKAEQIFGPPLNPEHAVFQLNDAYVIWLILDAKGNLLEVNVGPKSYYSSEFPNSQKPSQPEHFSIAEYQEALQRIGRLKVIGSLLQSHGSSTVATDFGAVNTDRFEYAFVDRIIADEAEDVRRFNVYFFQSMAGSPEEILTKEEQPMVCLVALWYYLSPDEAKKVEIGTWQTLQVAGPNLHGTTGCFRTAVLHDADGFTIEEPQNETITLSDIRVQALVGKVHVAFGDEPVEGVNVELRRVGSKDVLRGKTGPAGKFAFRGLPEGKYKFKVTKDGFKSLSGFVFLEHKAPTSSLSFALPVGT